MIDFLKYRPYCAIFSLLIFASFVGGIFYKRSQRGEAFIYSVDFTGGTQVLYKFAKSTNSNEVISKLEKAGYQGASARDFSPNEILVRVRSAEGDAQGTAEKIRVALADSLQTEVSTLSVDSVGEGIGAALRTKSLYAVIVALLLMLLYIWTRFWSLAFAVGNVVSLIHDAVVILTFVLWFDYEISLNIINAVLFILGYSINDTIVIFARIRENVAKMSGVAIEKIVNTSINETLRRTILTSLSTCLVVVALLVFGGEALRTLSLALFIGIVFGTYSSIYIASPVMLLLYNDDKR